MLTSTLIQILVKKLADHGDLEAAYRDSSGQCMPVDLVSWTKGSMGPGAPAVDVILMDGH